MGKIARTLLVVAVLLIALTVTLIYKYGEEWFREPEDLIIVEKVEKEEELTYENVVMFEDFWLPKVCILEGKLAEPSIYNTWTAREIENIAIEEWIKEKKDEWGVTKKGLETRVIKGERVEIGYVKHYELMSDRVFPCIEMIIRQGERVMELDNECVWFYTKDVEDKMWVEMREMMSKYEVEIDISEIMGVDKADVEDNTFVGLNQYNTGYTDASYFDIDVDSGFITGYHGQYKDAPEIVIIAPMVNGVEVKGIAKGAFYRYHKVNKIKAVVLPDSLRYIGDEAFKACDILEILYIPLDLQYIGEECFTGCEQLQEIRIPQGVTAIKERTFKGCSQLKKVEIQGNIDNVGSEAFSGCKQMYDIDLDKLTGVIMNDSFNNTPYEEIVG